MSYINAGIKEVFFTKGDANGINDAAKFQKGNVGAVSPATTIFGLGIRQEGSFVGDIFNEIKDKDNRTFKNLFNFKGEFSTMQVDIETLTALIEYVKDSSIATAIVTSGIEVSGATVIPSTITGGIFLFDTATIDQGLGLDFELNITQTERVLKTTFERAFKHADAVTLINDASTNSIPWETDKLPQIDTSAVLDGFISPSFISGFPAEVQAAFDDDANLAEFVVNIKTKSTKNGFNKSIISGFEVDLNATASGPDVPALEKGIDVAFPSDITVTLRSGETLVFKNNGLTTFGSFDLGDGNRTLKVNMTGTYDIDFVVSSAGSITFNTYLQA